MMSVSVFLSTMSNLSVFPAKGQNRILAEILKSCNSMVNSKETENLVSLEPKWLEFMLPPTVAAGCYK